MITLGIESSCDDTSVAVVRDGVAILSSLVSSQIEIHRRFGGVVPEVASRKHLEAVLPLLKSALCDAKIDASEIRQVAVTAGPGLIGPLLIGLSAAKAVAWQLRVPLIPVNHIEAHLAAAFLSRSEPPAYPFLGLIVSGGHSNMVLSESPRGHLLLGRTADDAPGELFDKIARHLGLGYPGGPVIQKTGMTGNPAKYRLPRPMIGKGLGFSFSGLKTAVLNLARQEGAKLDVPGLCASLQAAVTDTLMGKVAAALKETGSRRLIVAGGVAANKMLREAFAAFALAEKIELIIPPPVLCTDNAAMIAAQGFFSAHQWNTDALSCNARADWPIGAPL